MSKKNNQAKQKFSYKNDEQDLVDLGQFLREAFNIRVEREWCIFYDNNDKYLGYGKTMSEERRCKFRTPDLMIINPKTRRIICCVELDGSVHDVKLGDTMDRNDLYETLRIPLVIVNKSTIQVSMFDDAYKKVKTFIDKETFD